MLTVASSGAVGPGQAQNNPYLVRQPGPPLLQTSLAALQGGGCHPVAASSTASEPRRLATQTFSTEQ